MKAISIIIITTLLALTGCAVTPKEIVRTEYKTVEVPVTYNLNRPDRPEMSENEEPLVYLEEILSHTKLLEAIIDGTRKKR